MADEAGPTCFSLGAALVFELTMQKRRVADDVAFLQDITTTPADLKAGAELTKLRVDKLMQSTLNNCNIQSTQAAAVREALKRVDEYVQARRPSSFAGVTPTHQEALNTGVRAMLGLSMAIERLIAQ